MVGLTGTEEQVKKVQIIKDTNFYNASFLILPIEFERFTLLILKLKMCQTHILQFFIIIVAVFRHAKPTGSIIVPVQGTMTTTTS